MNSSLRSAEWLLVGGLLLILATLFTIAHVAASWSPASLPTQPIALPLLCAVKIEGAVKKPGLYPVPEGTELKAVLRKASPTRFADLRNIDLTARIEGPLEIFLEELKEITVRVEGAVLTPVELKLPIQAKVSDLRSQISLALDADASFFKSRRMLKEGEILTVPKKRG